MDSDENNNINTTEPNSNKKRISIKEYFYFFKTKNKKTINIILILLCLDYCIAASLLPEDKIINSLFILLIMLSIYAAKIFLIGGYLTIIYITTYAIIRKPMIRLLAIILSSPVVLIAPKLTFIYDYFKSKGYFYIGSTISLLFLFLVFFLAAKFIRGKFDHNPSSSSK